MNSFLQDSRYGIRQLLRQRGSSMVAIVPGETIRLAAEVAPVDGVLRASFNATTRSCRVD